MTNTIDPLVGKVYALVRGGDDPDANGRLAEEAAAVLNDSGFDVAVEQPTGGGRGAGPAQAVIDGWIWIALPLGGWALSEIVKGALGKVGSDVVDRTRTAWAKTSHKDRPLARSGLTIRIVSPANEYVLVELHPDDPEDAADLLIGSGFEPPKRPGGNTVVIRFDRDRRIWISFPGETG